MEGAFRGSRSSLVVLTLVLFLAGCKADAAEDQQPSNAFSRQAPTDIRVMSWNVKRNSILAPDGVRHEIFARIARALDPDVIALQEVLQRDLVAKLTQLMNRLIPLEHGRSWEVYVYSDNALLSRHPLAWKVGERTVPYPLPQFGLPDFHLGFVSALIDLPEWISRIDLMVIGMHNKSGGDEKDVEQRQINSDAIIRWVRELRGSEEGNTIGEGTPTILLGDMNVVPGVSTQPFKSLLSGDIIDEATFGPDFRIDRDETEMADAMPSHNGLGLEYYTWRNDNMPFEPSALDRIIFTDSVMAARRKFVLNTMTMSHDDLEYLGLRQSDVLYGGDPKYYDHLPLIVDFSIDSASQE